MLRGPQGWAEWGPFVEYPDAEAATWLRAALEWANQTPPKLADTEIEVNAILPAIDPARAHEVLGDLAGYSVLKLKIAEPNSTIGDLELVREIHRQYPNLKLRLDANGRLSIAAALQLARDCVNEALPIEYFEQPVASTLEMLELREALAREGLPIKIAADESVRKATDYLEAARLGAADLLVLKVAPLGGVKTALEVAQSAGLPVVVSSALETSVGMAAGAWLAGALPRVTGVTPAPSGLDTARLLTVDPAKRPLKIHHGRLSITRTQLDEDLALSLVANPARTKWWLDRLSRCLEHL